MIIYFIYLLILYIFLLYVLFSFRWLVIGFYIYFLINLFIRFIRFILLCNWYVCEVILYELKLLCFLVNGLYILV